MRTVLLTTLMAAFVGCHRAETAVNDVVSASLGRLEFLQNLAPSAERDEFYACLAEDACSDGLPDLTQVAINRIENDALRDTVALECALLLQKIGASEEANRIAQLIRNGDERHSVLRQVRLVRRK